MAFGTPYFVGVSTAGTAANNVIAVSTGTTAGDAIIVSAGNSSSTPTVSGVTDTKGNSYVSALGPGVSGQFGQDWIAPNAIALTTSDTITVQFSSTTGTKLCVAVACSGVAASSEIDAASAFTHATSAAPSITTGTLSQAVEMCIGTIFNASTGGTPTGLGSFTQITTQQSGASPRITVAYLQTASTSAVTFAGTITSANWSDYALMLLPAAASAQLPAQPVIAPSLAAIQAATW